MNEWMCLICYQINQPKDDRCVHCGAEKGDK